VHSSKNRRKPRKNEEQNRAKFRDVISVWKEAARVDPESPHTAKLYEQVGHGSEYVGKKSVRGVGAVPVSIIL
jgi:hypothetical protein